MLELLIARIKAKTTYINDCWLFNGALSNGYGIINWEGKTCKIHKISLCYFNNLNLFDEKIQANHKLECVNKNCWNPAHLYEGTPASNMTDRQQTDKAVSGIWGNASHELAKTHCPYGHEYTPENTKYQGNKRKCRECDRIRKRRAGSKPRNLMIINGKRKPYSNTK